MKYHVWIRSLSNRRACSTHRVLTLGRGLFCRTTQKEKRPLQEGKSLLSEFSSAGLSAVVYYERLLSSLILQHSHRVVQCRRKRH